MTSAKFLCFLRDFVPEYNHAKFGCNWTTNKGETEGGHNVQYHISFRTYMVLKDPSLNRVKFLQRGKAPGPDTIHNKVLRLGTTTSLFHHLARLFTTSIQLGYIPTAWKLATLRMLLKPDKLPSLKTSYRPISLISSISSIMKLFERVIKQRLRSHLEHIRFINKHQSGFRKAKSTNDHLFRLSQSIMESFNRGEHVVAAFLDVEKAFDNVWHNGLSARSKFWGGGRVGGLSLCHPPYHPL